jgi:hypothetical protein
MKMLVTAKLERAGRELLSDGIVLKQDYTVSPHHQCIVGTNLVVESGPHKDFTDADVYVVSVHPPSDMTDHLPFFNSKGWWGYATISVE